MESLKANDKIGASLISHPQGVEAVKIRGEYLFECRDKDGNLKWREKVVNHVATVGINLMLDTLMAGSGYSVTGPYMGLISGNSAYSTTATNDTMSSHAGWDEAGGVSEPTYSGNRKTCAWDSAAAGAISLSAALAFTFTGAGDVEGAFIVLGTGAVATKDDTNGTLFSAGVFSGGTKTVAATDILNVSYTVTITDT